MTNFRPLGNKLLVESKAKSDVSQGGIFIPGMADKEIFSEGNVISIGSGVENPPQVGELILYNGSAGSEVELDDKMYRVISETDIIGVSS